MADETLADILGRCWDRNIPDDAKNLLTATKAAVLSAHGGLYSNSAEGSSDAGDWYTHIEGELTIPIPELVNVHLADYETILLGVCNPGRREPSPNRGTVIYPVYLFGLSTDTTMVFKTAQPQPVDTQTKIELTPF